jgi:hypothetical protein
MFFNLNLSFNFESIKIKNYMRRDKNKELNLSYRDFQYMVWTRDEQQGNEHIPELIKTWCVFGAPSLYLYILWLNLIW